MLDHQANEKATTAATQGNMNQITLKTRPIRRLIFVIFSLATLLLLFPLFFEPRHRSLSCRSFWSCLNPFSSRLVYQDKLSTLDEDLQSTVIEATLSDGTLRFNRKLGTSYQPTLFLVVVSTNDETSLSWSRDYQSTRRSIYDFLDLIAGTGLDPQDIALGVLLLTAETNPGSGPSSADEGEFELIKAATDQVPLGRVTILQKNETTGHEADEDARRSRLARSRNYLMQRALHDERHVIWLDADVVELSPGIIQTMIRHAQSKPEVGIITTRVDNDRVDGHDQQTWAIKDESSVLAQTCASGGVNNAPELRKVMIEELVKSKTMVSDLVQGSRDGDLIRLDSVGATILYIRSDLLRHGLVFPWWNVVGTTWNDEGWFGLEAEGLCYLSRRMEGGGCFVLGGAHRVRRTDWS